MNYIDVSLDGADGWLPPSQGQDAPGMAEVELDRIASACMFANVPHTYKHSTNIERS